MRSTRLEAFGRVRSFLGNNLELFSQQLKPLKTGDEKSVEEIEVNDQEELSADDDSQIKLNL